MSTSKEYKNFILEQLDFIGKITCRSMMGEYLLYYDSVLFGGIYDNRLLVKITSNNQKFNMKKEIPYNGAKEMYMIEDLENTTNIQEIILDTYNDLKIMNVKKKTKK